MRNLLRRFISDTRGMRAGCTVLVLGCTALSVDVGSIYPHRRKAQSAADLVAIVAAGNLGKATSVAAATVTANGYPASALLSVQLGMFTANAALAPQARFVTPATGAPNAARVTLRTEALLCFRQQPLTSPAGRRPQAPRLLRSQSARGCSRSRRSCQCDARPNARHDAVAFGDGLSGADRRSHRRL